MGETLGSFICCLFYIFRGAHHQINVCEIQRYHFQWLNEGHKTGMQCGILSFASHPNRFCSIELSTWAHAWEQGQLYRSTPCVLLYREKLIITTLKCKPHLHLGQQKPVGTGTTKVPTASSHTKFTLVVWNAVELVLHI